MAEDPGLIARLIALLSQPGPRNVQTPVYSASGERMEASQPTPAMTRDPLQATAALGMSAADPMGLTSALAGTVSPGARESIQGLYDAQPEMAMAGSAMAPMGPVTSGAGALGKLIATAPKVSTPVLGGIGVATGSAGVADATQNANPMAQLLARQQQLMTQRDAAVAERDAQFHGKGGKKAGKGTDYNTADQEVKRLTGEMAVVDRLIADQKFEDSPERQIEVQTKKAEADRAAKLKTANTSIREMGADAMPYLAPATGLAAALVGGKIKGAHVDKFNDAMTVLQGKWKEAVAKANASTGVARQQAVKEAEELASDVAKLQEKGAGGGWKAAGGGLAVGEIGTFLPEEIDLARAIPGGELQANVFKPYQEDPWLLPKRLAAGAVTGLAPAEIMSLMKGRKEMRPAGYGAETRTLSAFPDGPGPGGPQGLPQSPIGSGPSPAPSGGTSQTLTRELAGQPASSGIASSGPSVVFRGKDARGRPYYKDEAGLFTSKPQRGKAATPEQSLIDELAKE
jgi:hypothetical protein